MIALKQQKYAEAEPLLRECLAIRDTKLPDDWSRFSAQSLLGTVASAFAISQSQSTLEFFLTGSMAKVLTLLLVIGLLMLRPQGLFVLKVRR